MRFTLVKVLIWVIHHNRRVHWVEVRLLGEFMSVSKVHLEDTPSVVERIGAWPQQRAHNHNSIANRSLWVFFIGILGLVPHEFDRPCLSFDFVGQAHWLVGGNWFKERFVWICCLDLLLFLFWINTFLFFWVLVSSAAVQQDVCACMHPHVHRLHL